jgi:hypothetical protein
VGSEGKTTKIVHLGLPMYNMYCIQWQMVGFDWCKGHEGALMPWVSVPQSIGVLTGPP